jgi:enolase
VARGHLDFMNIRRVQAHQVFDSRGNPTIETLVELENGAIGRGLVPSGASTGGHEALELRDGDPRRFLGRSVFLAIGHVNGEIARAMMGADATNQRALDDRLIALDGTADKRRLGANAVLSVSLAAACAAAAARGVPLYASLGQGSGRRLPLPEIQVFGGGKHAGRRIDVQDIMVVPLRAGSYEEALEVVFNVYHAAGRLMESRGRLAGVADEGGFWPAFDSNEDALAAAQEAIEAAGYAPARDVGLSLDFAATDLFRDGHYHLAREQRRYTSAEFVDLITSWIDRHPIVSIEDPCAEDDWDGWQRMRAKIGHRCQLVGDDLFATNTARLRRGVELRCANAVLIKLNQIGTVSETMDAIHLTQQSGWLPIISARSGETEDAFIAHLAVATNAGQLKVGSFSRGERMAKWNEVLRIGLDLGNRAEYLGAKIFAEAGIHYERA